MGLTHFRSLKPIKGRIENLSAILGFVSTLSHMRVPVLRAIGNLRAEIETCNTPAQKKQKRIDDFYVGISQKDEHEHWNELFLNFRRMITLRFALFRLVHEMTIALEIPKRRTFGEPILNRCADACAGHGLSSISKCQNTTRECVTFHSNVWKRIAKAHFIGCLLWLFGKQVTYGLFPTGSRHDGVAIAQHLEKVLVKMNEAGWVIGAFVTDNAGQCDRARSFWSSVARNCIRDMFCLRNDQHGKYCSEVGIRKGHNRDTTSKKSSFPRHAEMHGCFAYLLRVLIALKMLETKFQGEDEIPSALHVVGKRIFKEALSDAKEVIRPFAFAPLKPQRNENTSSDVVINKLAQVRNRVQYLDCVDEAKSAKRKPLTDPAERTGLRERAMTGSSVLKPRTAIQVTRPLLVPTTHIYTGVNRFSSLRMTASHR
ncbi:hypothetical protein GN958_ATG19025 [Phytophthora infestans]|uniref:DUF659 domain-containing protein n=1 Tax=Phytophthora infestans TaxID=4787 RepID=A0A8S9U0S0_PHYIN|nr:hypothetical protein GN958_ATG19025 [Phytophthora infestans]